MAVKIKIITDEGDETGAVRSCPIPDSVDDKVAFIDRRVPVSVDSIEEITDDQ